jgi:hypothetical protein
MLVVLGLEKEYPNRLGVSIDEVLARLASEDKLPLEAVNFGKILENPRPVRGEIESKAAEALRLGFLSPIPNNSSDSATRFITTDRYHDLVLFGRGMRSFNLLLEGARDDDRFDEFFKRLHAGMP